VVATIVLAWLMAVPSQAAGQRAVPRGGAGGHVSGDGGRPSGGGSPRGEAGPRTQHRGGDDRGDHTGPRDDRGDAGGGTSTSARRAIGRAPSGGATTGGTRAGRASTDANGEATGGGGAGDTAAHRPEPGDAALPSGRTRDGRPATGQAIPRAAAPPSGDGGTIYVPGGYYGGYLPWGYGGLGLGGYYEGYYEPWYGGYPAYPQNYSLGYDGAMRLKVKPREASVYVDGYFAGQVDDFDGVFQRLHIESGPHRIEIRADGYEPLSFEVRIQPDRKLTYQGELRKLP
jgi:hypothetical protein